MIRLKDRMATVDFPEPFHSCDQSQRFLLNLTIVELLLTSWIYEKQL